ncbi:MULTISPECIES: DUF5623 domain-containing protein [Pseudomonas]|uniref:DUF5623 domain-containing protein n=1 Tax=Pseudomonas TaxID=286 RepID=UPI00053D86B8|nr:MULTISPECIES: DUF5623 domain-containing protein [Pseudomonas]ELL0594215.1 DUF5623 domain-containing protein [Pseudomonas aeruginosa]EMB4856968.1 DUF5623 domain-containing protein [Pseudomonas aeruginosa]MBG6720645.1 DUF5623 domain-containing protein [Pseudomonas aeruginosa]MBU5935572.1 DUF5623 domain-containing protein [Pseudomonas aeruginosa]MCT5588132.1 DUF5623 domain-containing protein [Pseudomonas aeruginosa]
MSSYSSRLARHLKSRAKQLRSDTNLAHSRALETAAIDFGFTGWKQAQAHMEQADARIRDLEVSLPHEIARQAAELRTIPGYPYALDDQVGVRYLPADKQQTEGVARRLILLRLFEEVHAPQNLNRSESAQLWFRAPMSWEDASEVCQGGPVRIQRLANAIRSDPQAPTWFGTDSLSLTPESARATVLQYLHALHSLSVVRILGGTSQEVIEHPCFKEFASSVLATLLGRQKQADAYKAVLDYAGISDWVQSGPGLIEPDRLNWIGRESPPMAPLSSGVSMLVGSPNHPRLRKPLNSLPLEQHQELAGAISLLSRYAPGKTGLQKNLDEFRDTLAGWLAVEIGSQERAFQLYANKLRAYQAVSFLAPAEERENLATLQNIRRCIETGYEQCIPRAHLLGKFGKVELAFERWIARTRDHWKRPNHKLLMDSIGLVGIDPKEEPLLESEGDWKQTDLMGTSRETNLIASIRPHLFMTWKEEDEAEGYAFDEADADSEQSILDHLYDLTFYRYTGSATTPAKFMKDVRKAFYFRPVHVWFKQRKIG